MCPDIKQLYDSAPPVTFCKLLSINNLRRPKTEKHKLLTISSLRRFSPFYANKTNKSNKLLVYKDLRFFKNIFCKLLITSNLRILRSPRAPKSLILNDLSCYFLGLTRSAVCAILIEVSEKRTGWKLKGEQRTFNSLVVGSIPMRPTI